MNSLLLVKYCHHFVVCMQAGFKNCIAISLLALPVFVLGQAEALKLLHQADSLLQIEQEEMAIPILKEVESMKLTSSAVKLQLQYLKGSYYNSLEDITKVAEALLDLPERAEKEKEFRLSVLSHILLALINEKTDDLQASKKHLNKADMLIKTYGLDSLYAWYCVRKSSIYRFSEMPDSAIHYAQLAISYGEKYGQMRPLSDGYLLMGILHSKEPKQSSGYFQSALKIYKQGQNFKGISTVYLHLSNIHLKTGDLGQALMYNDSAVGISNLKYLPILYYVWKIRSEIYQQNNKLDSAFYFYKKYSDGMILQAYKQEGEKIKTLTEGYELDKKNSTIRIKEKQLKITLLISILIALTSMALYKQNKRIKKQNIQIQSQFEELNKLIKQKQILLKEMQHRVKNNLQHVLSPMDIQGESLTYNTISEVIRENQNRVHSMALLHNKLSYLDGTDTVNFEEYLQELAALIKAAYFDPEKEINIQIDCSVKQLDIDTAIPLGLVAVELLSNSFKHAFKNNTKGEILLSLSFEIISGKKLLIYRDNGCGFNFAHPPKNGLGLELIAGLLKEINASIHINNENGTKYTILF